MKQLFENIDDLKKEIAKEFAGDERMIALLTLTAMAAYKLGRLDAVHCTDDEYELAYRAGGDTALYAILVRIRKKILDI